MLSEQVGIVHASALRMKFSECRLRPVWPVLWLGLICVGGFPAPAPGAIINVTTNDNYAKIESAKPGDTVLIAPGTYAFRVYLTRQAGVTNPITIQAQFPTNPPVWDFGATNVENAPGSYTAGDRGRGGWQFSGARNYNVSGIIFRHCRTASFNSAGIRYYNGTTNLYVKDCVFDHDDNGLTGGTQDSAATVEYCEFNGNGNTNASTSSPTHNIYVYGGWLTLRYCYVHDPVQGQNFHIRCRSAVLEYNWFARANSYEGDLMTDDDFSGAGPFSQALTLRGNVIVQKNAPLNHSQVIAIYNDARLTNLTLNVQAIYNTFVGNGGSAAFVHVSNADHTAMNAAISDNIISGTTLPFLIEYTNNGVVTGMNNWLPTGATTGPLTGSILSATPGFRQAADQDYTLAGGSPCIGVASSAPFGLPGREYYLNETNNRQWRIRDTARDLGAFERTATNEPVGPYDPVPRPQLKMERAPAGAGLTVSMPLFAQDYAVEQSPVGASPAAWTAASCILTTNATNITALLPFTSGSAGSLFRLEK
jgi:hypothetical protein